MEAHFFTLGEAALGLQLRRKTSSSANAPFDLPQQKKIWSCAAQVRHLDGVVDAVPGMNNLTLIFDPNKCAGDQLLIELQQAWKNCSASDYAPRHYDLPVSYGGVDGPDLEEVAAHANVSISSFIAMHTDVIYSVYFLGFQPGFAYLGDLPKQLHCPRRAEPRLRVPAGSVAIGGAQTGIYPQASPGGWQIIGRTNIRCFDASKAAPSLFLPGDTVQFIANDFFT